MKDLSFISVFFLLMCSVSLEATSESSVPNTFLQCLLDYPHPSSYPISEAIFTPSNASFSSILSTYVRNLRFASPDTPKPLVLVTAFHASHVQATVTCCKFHDLLLKTRSGGHDDEGLSYISQVPFIVLDMFNLRSIKIDLEDESTWVQSGATLGEVYYRIAEKSNTYGFPAGVCPTVGAGGHFSGGGYGNLMRKYGLSIDNIVDAQLVDVSGSILDRFSMGEDLFWAIRGGGGASFGVIFTWKIKLVPVPEVVTVFKINRTTEQGALNMVLKWQQVASQLHEDLFIRLKLQGVNGSEEGERTVSATFLALFLGTKEKLFQLMTESFPELGLEQNECHEMSWIESTVFWYEFPYGTSTQVLLDRTPIGKTLFKYKSDFVKKPISRIGLEVIWDKLIESENVFMMWNPYGGRMSEILESETPFPHRAGNIFKIQYLVHWSNKSTEASNHRINLERELYEVMTPYVSCCPREAFINYRDLDLGSSPNCNATYEEAKVYGTKYFKANFERLVQVKTRVDPTNFFRNEQSIPPLPIH